MTEHAWPPCYFHRSDGRFHPTGLARSPWSRQALAGGPVSALLATLFDLTGLDPAFNVARFSVDILGVVPNQPLEGRVVTVREGRQMQLHRAELVVDGRVAAQAHVLRVRDAGTPAVVPRSDYPAWSSMSETEWLPRASMAGAIRTRPVQGSVGEPGRGIGWISMNGEIVAGTPPSNFVKAALIADFGNGIGSATPRDCWSFANLDITLQFLRMPSGDWLLIDAETATA